MDEQKLWKLGSLAASVRWSELTSLLIRHVDKMILSCGKNGILPLWSSSPKNTTPVQSWGNHHTDPNWGTSYEMLDHNYWKLLNSSKTRKVCETISLRKSKEIRLNVIQYPREDPETEKGNEMKSKEIQIKDKL